MKNLEQFGLEVLDAAELQQVQGGVTEGGCIQPFPFPFLPHYPYPPFNPTPPFDYPTPIRPVF
ncbi:hypothetical protein AAE02nite_48030 [Adhaeribacter aerolatus]|uniref:Bacteriocin n=1 Tax=Adhaeribacter aerolatus TaxID=670289 RepID=A0A512B5B0_9BACT|nr:hypothetical protein [Adhaeribacter aerolatus]GEO07139.1 hypothetical protein AAE02nite_48030 [Adhaeribacter aerolatus]